MVEDSNAGIGHFGEEFAFCLGDRFSRTQQPDMGRSHIRNDGDIRAGNVGEFGNLPQSPHRHFNDSKVAFGGESEEGFGNADFVVVVGLGFENLALGSQNGSDQFFGGGFTDGTGNADDGSREAIAPPTTEGLVGFEGIAHLKLRNCDIDGAIDNGCDRPLFGSGCHKLMSVKLFPPQCHEEITRFDAAAVGGDAATDEILTLGQVFG